MKKSHVGTWWHKDTRKDKENRNLVFKDKYWRLQKGWRDQPLQTGVRWKRKEWAQQQQKASRPRELGISEEAARLK
jgi:hypothetical protein